EHRRRQAQHHLRAQGRRRAEHRVLRPPREARVPAPGHLSHRGRPAPRHPAVPGRVLKVACRRGMQEVRVDPLTGQKSIIASDRAPRPGGGLECQPAAPVDPQKDPFAEGHEDQTPPEVYAVRSNGAGPDTPGWTVRVVPNLYPALTPGAPAPE